MYLRICKYIARVCACMYIYINTCHIHTDTIYYVYTYYEQNMHVYLNI